jgi:Highly conserved protein containing a thioredoxin domain
VIRIGRLAMSAADAGDVLLRLRPTQDDAIPNAHPVAIEALVRAHALSGETRYRDAADALLTATAGAVQGNIIGHVGLLNALDFYQRGRSVVILGSERAALAAAARGAAWLDCSVLEIDDAATLPTNHPARAQADRAGRGAAFVCQGQTCQLPAHDPASLAALLAKRSAVGNDETASRCPSE